MADLIRKVNVTRTRAGVTVKATVQQDNCTSSYTVSPYGSNIELASKEALEHAEKNLKAALKAAS